MPEIPQSFSKLQLPPINKQSQVSMIEMVLLLIISVLFYWFVVAPKKTELKALDDKVDTLKTESAKVESQKEELARYIRSMKSDSESIAKLDEALPLNGKTMALNLLIVKLASEAGVTLENYFFNIASDAPLGGNRDLIVDPFAGKRTLKKINGSVSVKGQLDQIQTFFKKLESSGRIFEVTDVQLTSDPQGLIHLTGSLNTYYFAP